jgi:hypothetical protein
MNNDDLVRVYFLDEDGEYTGEYKDCLPLNADNLREKKLGTTIPPKEEDPIEEEPIEMEEEIIEDTPSYYRQLVGTLRRYD